MDKKRLFILIPGHTIFGQERALINIALMLRRHGVESTFLIHKTWGMAAVGRHVADLNFDYVTIPLGHLWSGSLFLSNPFLLIKNFISLFRSSKEMWRILDQHEMVLLGNPTFAVYILPALWMRQAFVVYRHGDAPPKSSFLLRAIARLVYRYAKDHVANSEYIAREIKLFARGLRPRVIYNFPVQLDGMDCARPFIRQVSGELGGVKQLIFIGQLSKHKGVYLILDAFEALAERYPELRLVFAGASPDLSESRVQSFMSRVLEMKRTWRNRITLVGYLEEVREVLTSGSLHLCPSIWDDPSPNVIFEAKACAVPSVCFPRGGIPELIQHAEDGYLCEGQTAGDLALGIEFFCNDPVRYEIACRNAKKSLDEKFGYMRYQQAWLEVLRPLPVHAAKGSL